MTAPSFRDLSRREREVLEIVYSRGQAAASEVLAAMAEPPSNSSVRTVLRQLVKKGLLEVSQDGVRHVYSPVVRRDRARRGVLRDLLRNFFDDSPRDVVSALLDVSAAKISEAELEEIEELVRRAKEEGR